jgi:hypothetical protein
LLYFFRNPIFYPFLRKDPSDDFLLWYEDLG